jgi:quinolinate synthase
VISTATLADEIQALKIQRRAAILAHYYQDPEIQQLADCVADHLELAQTARALANNVIVYCGVRVMAETAKILNPARTVIIPDKNAGCSLAESCSAEAIRAFRRQNPSYVIVAHLNTSAQVKAESDILCTTANAVAIVNSIPPRQPILFVPDIHLGNYVQRQTGRKNMKIWQGACIVHATFSARAVVAARAAHPQALIAAHPECPAHVLQMADFVGSAAEIVDWCPRQAAAEFIIVGESGMRHALQRLAPGKQFHFVTNESCNCSECPYSRLNSLEKLLACLQTLEPRIELSDDIIRRARLPLERMLAVN